MYYTPRKINHPWEGRIEPFRIAGNVYFVGRYQASTHLIDTGDGLILIDPGYMGSFYLVVHSIHTLGFRPQDVKYVINTHWHSDHAEASEALVDLSGAKTLIGRYDAENVSRYFAPDILIKDGDRLSLGNTAIDFLETPGHTKGTISLFFDVEEAGRTWRAGMFGGAGANTLLAGKFEYDDCRADYMASLDRLRREKVGLFLGNHVWNNDTEGKGKILRETGENRFLDEGIWETYLDFCRARLERIVAREQAQA